MTNNTPTWSVIYNTRLFPEVEGKRPTSITVSSLFRLYFKASHVRSSSSFRLCSHSPSPWLSQTYQQNPSPRKDMSIDWLPIGIYVSCLGYRVRQTFHYFWCHFPPAQSLLAIDSVQSFVEAKSPSSSSSIDDTFDRSRYILPAHEQPAVLARNFIPFHASAVITNKAPKGFERAVGGPDASLWWKSMRREIEQLKNRDLASSSFFGCSRWFRSLDGSGSLSKKTALAILMLMKTVLCGRPDGW